MADPDQFERYDGTPEQFVEGFITSYDLSFVVKMLWAWKLLKPEKGYKRSVCIEQFGMILFYEQMEKLLVGIYAKYCKDDHGNTGPSLSNKHYFNWIGKNSRAIDSITRIYCSIINILNTQNMKDILHLPNDNRTPEKIITDFLDTYDLEGSKKRLWNWLKVAVGKSYDQLGPGEQTGLIMFYEDLEKLLIALYAKEDTIRLRKGKGLG